MQPRPPESLALKAREAFTQQTPRVTGNSAPFLKVVRKIGHALSPGLEAAV